MKIIIYLRHYPKPGGTTNAVNGLSLGLIKQGVDVTIFGEHSNLCDSNLSVPYGIPCKLFENKSRNLFHISKILVSYLEYNSENIDLFIINGIFSPYNFSLSLFLKKNNIKYIFSPHEPYHSSRYLISTVLKKIYLLTLESYIINNSEAIQVLDVTHQDLLHNSINFKKKCIVVPNGFNIENAKEPVFLSNTSDGEVIRLFTLCRIDSFVKGLDLVIKALGLLKDEMNFFLQSKDPKEEIMNFF